MSVGEIGHFGAGQRVDGNSARSQTIFNPATGAVTGQVALAGPMTRHGFGGWKKSLFGDTHAYGEEGVGFYTKQKSVMQRWPKSISKGAEFAMPVSR